MMCTLIVRHLYRQYYWDYVGVYIGCNVAMYRRVSIHYAVHTYSG
jgi:hypothetical protein